MLDFDLCWQEIRKGEEQALERVYKAAFTSLVNYAADITGHRQQAEEAVQDVFLKIWRSRGELNIKGSFKAYLFQAVHNHSLNLIRQQKSRKESVNILTSEKCWQFISDNYRIDDALTDKIFSEETELIIERAVKELPEQCSRVFNMSRAGSMKNDEIAVRLGLSENTVKTHIYRALQKIALALKLQE